MSADTRFARSDVSPALAPHTRMPRRAIARTPALLSMASISEWMRTIFVRAMSALQGVAAQAPAIRAARSHALVAQDRDGDDSHLGELASVAPLESRLARHEQPEDDLFRGHVSPPRVRARRPDRRSGW